MEEIKVYQYGTKRRRRILTLQVDDILVLANNSNVFQMFLTGMLEKDCLLYVYVDGKPSTKDRNNVHEYLLSQYNVEARLILMRDMR